MERPYFTVDHSHPYYVIEEDKKGEKVMKGPIGRRLAEAFATFPNKQVMKEYPNFADNKSVVLKPVTKDDLRKGV